jgi:hypothetical protein
MPPLQFATLVGEAVLAVAAHGALPQTLAAFGFAVAAAGLAAIVLRDRWVEHRARKLVDWQQFEQALASYTDGPQPDAHRDDSHHST